MKRNYLILSPFQKNIPKNFKILSLQKYFIKNEKKEKRFHNLEYHWNYPKKVDKDYVYLEKIHTKLVKSLSISLNQFHNVNFNERYWRILLDPFLFYYISTFFDRWEQIRSASRIKGKLYLGIPNFENKFKTPRDVRDFISIVNHEDWNIKILEKIICYNFKNKFTFLGNYPRTNIKNYFQLIRSRVKFINYIFFLCFHLVNLFAKKRKFAFISTNITKKNLFKLYSYFKSFFTFFDDKLNVEEKKFRYSSHNTELRQILFQDSRTLKKKTFENFLKINLPDFLPLYLCEDYKKINRLVKNINFDVKYIITSYGLWSNPFRKVWLANSINNGSKIFIKSHGGAIPVKSHTFNFLNDVSDKKLTWYSPVKKGQTQIVSELNENNILEKINTKSCKREKIGIVLQSKTRWSFRIEYTPMSSQILETHLLTKNFIEKLKPKIKSQILIKPYQFSHSREDMIFKKFKKNFYNKKYFDLLNISKIIICTYPETSFSEAMISNRPTILIYKKNHYQFPKKFMRLLNNLKKNNIIFHDPDKAAKFINMKWDLIDKWWNSNAIQTIRNDFLKSCLNYDKGWLNSWRKFIINLK